LTLETNNDDPGGTGAGTRPPSERKDPMRRTNAILCGAALLLLAALAPAQQPGKPKVDLTGSWTGHTFIGDGSRAEFSLILAKAENAYAGKISDETGQMPEMQIKNVAFKDPDLTFEVDFPNGAETQLIKIQLKLEGDSLKGSWLDEEGNSNVIELARKK
jgi:hypothetical protein